MATFTTMEASVYAVLRDTGKTFVLSTEVKEWLNEGYLDIVARAGTLRKEATGTTEADGEIALPADFIRLTSFRIATDVADLLEAPSFARDDVFLYYRNNDDSSVETLYRIFNGKIQTWPEAQSVTYFFEYVYKPTPLSAGGDVPAIPEELHRKIIDYARWQAKLKEQEFTDAMMYKQEYEAGLPPLPSGAEDRENPGPQYLTPVLDYWANEFGWE